MSGLGAPFLAEANWRSLRIPQDNATREIPAAFAEACWLGLALPASCSVCRTEKKRIPWEVSFEEMPGTPGIRLPMGHPAFACVELLGEGSQQLRMESAARREPGNQRAALARLRVRRREAPKPCAERL
jgi:hypothetical protein